METLPKDSSSAGLIRKIDYVLLPLFVAMWLIPLGYRGISGRQNVPGMPVVLNYFQNAACLFSDDVDSWHDYYVLGRVAGDDGWFELPDSVYSPMQPFGYRSRMDFLIGNQWYSRNRNLSEQRTALAEWYRKRYDALHPGEPGLRALKIAVAVYPIGELPPGSEKRWNVPPFDEIPREFKRDTYVHTFKR